MSAALLGGTPMNFGLSAHPSSVTDPAGFGVSLRSIRSQDTRQDGFHIRPAFHRRTLLRPPV